MARQAKPRQRLFEEKLAKIRRHLKHDRRHGSDYFPAPFVIEFGGSPDSGKSTTIEKLYQTLHRNGFSVATPQEGAMATQHISRKSPLYNYYTGIYALKILLDAVHMHTFDVVILDRGIFDTPTWMEYWLDKGAISKDERDTATKFFLSRLWVKHVTASYYFIADPDVAVSRDLEFASTDVLGDSSNPESIARRAKHYRELFEKLGPNYPQLELIDTTHLNRQGMVDLMTEKVLGAIERQIAEREKEQ
ncbi:MAG: hypothetical protein A3C93_03275 [Candidatus Lloydbacteria bacterium RIFCSPHIGHO2_02_FULL_54_17]|uniref:Thymidylate kinase-like domain-containing protein n=1 Tax=Candidatus Lloydbacteria bacterium RIFCSPHIGHO2_02_FULL_54_17 TaxID=1798664 RepID=A0A1G2DJ72_9BACT|nr:MAG: hypothetical protein A3C93_03275 [Candidatus Lloydbacteria bacterium RIFCSPHIGHO2_02_FULL_54_17]OGZ14871.1 MAG: hypothetical protein A2948_02300 [Candidatus Lloydbacteria bacterium RIFCSPLOWO2_01_FULL_54_18]OGZ16873.1 MAG: hypothetical protein A3H76_01105 [Candidatus Lloydbacteria bacterium RIFCSPLOWO2_02_FULL_54_12]